MSSLPSRRDNNGLAGGLAIAGSALRRAGLVEQDTGMRDATTSSSTRGSRNSSNRASSSAAASSSSGQPRGGGRTSARERSNPMGSRQSRPDRRGKASTELLPANQPQGSAQSRGRAPGGSSGSSRTTSARSATNSTQFKSNGTIDTLRRFITSRWNAQSSYLNLDSMRTDPILLEKGLKPPGSAGAHKDIANVLWKLCSEAYPNMVTLSLASNELRTVGAIYSLPLWLPNLRNISLQNNEIKWTKELGVWSSTQSSKKSARFSDLHELILQGNPVYSNAVAASNEHDYRAEVISKFPGLRLLDGQTVTDTEREIARLPPTQRAVAVASNALAALGPPKNFALQMKAGFSDGGAQSITPDFLGKFFAAFDCNRDSLLPLFGSESKFTFVVVGAVSPRARAHGYLHSLPNQKKLHADAYNSLASRNVMRQGLKAATKGIRFGPGQIMSCYQSLPKTTHPLTDASKFVVDSWVLPNTSIGAQAMLNSRAEAVLFINVHGEYAEGPSQGLRSFDRTFVVAPALPESSAAKSGWPCMIISDQLTVRQYSGTDAWGLNALPLEGAPNLAGPSTIATTPSSAGTQNSNQSFNSAGLPVHLQTQAPAPNLTEAQHYMALQFAAQSQLTYPFAIQCLEQNQWEPNAAMRMFNNFKAAGSIPPEAFA